MGVNFSKNSHIVLFGLLFPFLSVLIAWVFSKIINNPPFWIESLSPMFAYGILYSLFEKYAWKWKIFNLMGIVYYPNLEGRWKGRQQSSYKQDGENKVIPAYLEIKQNFSKIRVCAYYERSQSGSIVANFAEVNDCNYLFYTYDSDPNSLKEGTMQSHKGTVKLQHISKENKLIGTYFNNIGNQGEVEFNFEGKDFYCRYG